ncbi:hypothetical protein BH23BAC1_BH23BAC1_24780 [soil metagenome]
MKKLYFLSLLCILIVNVQAKVITVDNNEGAGADFSTLSEAIGSASNGDSIYVQASSKDYGNVTLAKKIFLIGPGHYPESTGSIPASLLVITLQNGSSGSLITGFQAQRIECSVWNTVEDIIIENNYFSVSWYMISGPFGDSADGDNWIIRGNIFVEPAGCGGCSIIDVNQSQFGNENWNIANNIIISKPESTSTNIFERLNASTMVINNTIIHRNNEPIFKTGNNAMLKNNIIVSLSSTLTDITANCTSCTWENNLTYSPNATLGTLSGTGNINNTDPAFVDVPASYNWTYDGDFNVKETSAAHNAGTDSKDLGAFGANYNFSKFGYPFDVPVIEEFRIENQLLNQGDKLRFSIKARGARSN